MNEAEFQEATHFYYRSGSPEAAAEALKYFVTSPYLGDFANARPIMAYLFARIARRDPEALWLYEAVLPSASPAGRLFILEVLARAGDERGREHLAGMLDNPSFRAERNLIRGALEAGSPVQTGPLDRSVRDARDLDLLWAEFFVTGDSRAVVHIIDVLEWPDRVRELLTTC